MVIYNITVSAFQYPDIVDLTDFVHRCMNPSEIGKLYGSIYHTFTDIPNHAEYMKDEINEAADYLTDNLKMVKSRFQKEIFEHLVKRPPSHEDIYFLMFYIDNDSIYVRAEIAVDMHDGTESSIDITDANIEEYFTYPRTFKQDRVVTFSDAEAATYQMFGSDYYEYNNPFPTEEKYQVDSLMPSCRNFTFQVTEDCNLRCYGAGTKVLMWDLTYKNIEDVQLGDVVFGFDKNHTGIINAKPATVTHTFRREARVIKLTTSFGETLVTPTHNQYTTRGEWVETHHLDPDIDHLITIEAEHEEKSVYPYISKTNEFSIDKKQLFHHPIPVYNIETTTGTYVANNIATSNCSYCFVAGTKVLMEDYTTKSIEDVQIGDMVLGFAESASIYNDIPLYPTEVTANFSRETEVIEVVLANIKSILCTPEHPFLTSRGWVEAQNLTLGDRLVKYYNHSDDVFAYTYPQVVKTRTLKQPLRVYNLETTSHTFTANGYLVHNCYQTNKCASIMDIDTAKSAVDDLLKGSFEYLSPGFSRSIILEFIGGDPLLEIDLIEEIYVYFLREAYRLNHPWFHHHRVSICSNGLFYFNKSTKRFFDRYSKQISFNISIDGNKQLHDSCRIQPTGEGSYDIGIAGVHHSNQVYRMELSSKMTLAPSNIPMIAESVKNLCIENSYPGINLNVVFEDVWSTHDAGVLYAQMKKVSDMLMMYNRPDIFLSFFRNPPMMSERDPSNELSNVCGGSGSMLSIDPHGTYYPCIRYMPSSLNGEAEPLVLGDIKNKMDSTIRLLREFRLVTQMSQQNDRCLSCPMVTFCNWCFKEGTLVLTPTGLRDIKDIQEGDLVISHDGSTRTVVRKMQHLAKDMLSIKAKGCPTLHTTSTHKFLVSKKLPEVDHNNDLNLPIMMERYPVDEFVAYAVGSVIGNSKIVLPCGWMYVKNISGNTDTAKTSELNDILAECEKDGKKILPNDIYQWNEISIKRFLEGVLDKMESGCYLTDIELANGVMKLAKFMNIEADIVELGEGKYRVEKKDSEFGLGIMTRACDIEIGNKMALYRDSYSKLVRVNKVISTIVGSLIADENVSVPFDMVKVGAYTSRDKEISNEYIDKTLNNDLQQLLAECEKDGKKIIPMEMYHWDSCSIDDFLEVVFKKMKDGNYLTSKELAVGIAMLARSVGTEADIVELGEGKYRVEKTSSIERLYDFSWGEVEKIEKANDSVVYNLTVEGTHTYIADGVVASNCTGYCYQVNGTANERTTYICDMIKAEFLGSMYYWSNMVLRYPEFNIQLDEKFPDYFEFEDIIDRNEYDKLMKLFKKAKMVETK